MSTSGPYLRSSRISYNSVDMPTNATSRKVLGDDNGRYERNSFSLASQCPKQCQATGRVGLPEQHKSHSDLESKSVKMEHWSARCINKMSTDSSIAPQELLARRVTSSVAKSSRNDIVFTVEKD
jgi:hypothetical protein